MPATIPGLTDQQQRACEAATKLGDPRWHDNLLADIAARLPDPLGGPWPNSVVQTAIVAMLADTGLDTPFLA
jgi:hypothetical protein